MSIFWEWKSFLWWWRRDLEHLMEEFACGAELQAAPLVPAGKFLASTALFMCSWLLLLLFPFQTRLFSPPAPLKKGNWLKNKIMSPTSRYHVPLHCQINGARAHCLPLKTNCLAHIAPILIFPIQIKVLDGK